MRHPAHLGWGHVKGVRLLSGSGEDGSSGEMSLMEDGGTRPMFFVLGRGRSGTTLLRCMLDVHPKISVPPEAMFVMLLRGRYAGVRDWDRDRIHSFCLDLWRERRLLSWHLDPADVERRLMSVAGKASFPVLCRKVYESYAAARGKNGPVLLGDKNPHYCLFAGELMELFPRSRFVHFVRDPRDNVLSFQRVGFDLNGTAALAYRWKRYNLEVLRYSREYPDRFLLLRFEDLLSDPESCLEKLCSFLGVEFDPVMLDFHAMARDVPEWEWHGNLSRPLDPSRCYGWKDRMGQREVCVVESVCGELIDSFGYERACPEVGVWPSVSARPGMGWGWFFTLLEKLVFALPLGLRSGVVNLYRRMTGSLPGSGR
ncbi:hypothetical protein GF402_10200 [Candidatus Fermentibacteria bacterium]|nr:hypothetical protein [Candidatus Fermentibacteria bacterium]